MTPLKPLTLGKISFSSNLIQGPLAGVSKAPFRFLIWRYSKPAFTCTEMISCKTILHQNPTALKSLIAIEPEEGPVSFQLSSSDPIELAEATKRVTDFGAHLIDLNCGCPVKKIRRRGAGSRLLMDAAKIYQLICAMKNNTHLPVSIKIRVEGNSDDKFNADIAQAVTEAGLDFLVVHGRHWTEHYETPCHYEDITFFVETLKIPVIGNGDVACLYSLKRMLDTGCAGAMIGRAGVGQPWLIEQLTTEMNHQNFILPSPEEIGSIFIEHVERLITLLGNEKFAILQARKLAKYYARRLPSKIEFNIAINECENIKNVTSLCLQHFKS